MKKQEREFEVEVKAPNKYLFEATYKDGIVYSQGADDTSLFVTGKNAFYDILYEPHKPIEELVEFSLKGDGHTYSVNLRDGHFEIDGVAIQVGDDMPLDHDKCEFRLIYFKRHTHHMNLNFVEKEHLIKYFIGWQTTIQGKNYQQTISVE